MPQSATCAALAQRLRALAATPDHHRPIIASGLQRRVRRARRPYPAASVSVPPEMTAEKRARAGQAGAWKASGFSLVARLIGSARLARAVDSAVDRRVACPLEACEPRSQLEWVTRRRGQTLRLADFAGKFAERRRGVRLRPLSPASAIVRICRRWKVDEVANGV